MALTDSPPTTTNYNITLPEVGGNRNTWGGILNASLESVAGELYTVDNVLGETSDSSTPSLAYQLTQAVTAASIAETNSATAIDVATHIVNQYLVAVVSALNSLDAEVGDTSTSGTVAYNANQAKLDAASAYTTAVAAYNAT
jgi:hypothetical protein